MPIRIGSLDEHDQDRSKRGNVVFLIQCLRLLRHEHTRAVVGLSGILVLDLHDLRLDHLHLLRRYLRLDRDEEDKQLNQERRSDDAEAGICHPCDPVDQLCDRPDDQSVEPSGVHRVAECGRFDGDLIILRVIGILLLYFLWHICRIHIAFLYRERFRSDDLIYLCFSVISSR